ncbi:MAG: hypothetical protein AB1345_14175, partial [Chloroflexota bacterium]
MDNRDAFVLAPVSSDKSISIDVKFEAYELLKQVDEVLRGRLGLELRMVNLGAYAYEECKRLIKSEGITSVVLSLSNFSETKATPRRQLPSVFSSNDKDSDDCSNNRVHPIR